MFIKVFVSYTLCVLYTIRILNDFSWTFKRKILFKLPPSRDAENLFLRLFDHGIIIINRARIRGRVRRSQFEIRRVSRLWRKSCNRSRLRSRLLHRSWKALEFDKLSCSLKFCSISPLNQIVCLFFFLTKIHTFKYIILW